jgi:hypothetical protein
MLYFKRFQEPYHTDGNISLVLSKKGLSQYKLLLTYALLAELQINARDAAHTYMVPPLTNRNHIYFDGCLLGCSAV